MINRDTGNSRVNEWGIPVAEGKGEQRGSGEGGASLGSSGDKMCTNRGHRKQREGVVNGGLERQDWGAQEKGDGEEGFVRKHLEEAGRRHHKVVF